MSDRSKAPALKSVKGGPAPLPLHAPARVVARTSLAIILVVLSAWIAFDFLPALGWAVILAIATWPLYVRFARLIPDQRSALIAPLTFTVLTGLLLFVPAALAIHGMARESADIVHWITQLRDTGIAVPDWVAQLPIAGEHAVTWWRNNLSDPQAASAWFPDGESAAGWMKAIGGQLLHRLFMFFIALIGTVRAAAPRAWMGERSSRWRTGSSGIRASGSRASWWKRYVER